MATKKKTNKRRKPARIALPEILSIIEKAYDPDGELSASFEEVTDKNGKLVTPDELGDTLADFLIRKMGDVFNKRAGRRANLDTAADAVNSAIRQLMDVEAALLRANYGDDNKYKIPEVTPAILAYSRRATV